MSPKASAAWGTASRVSAALFGGYGLVYASTAFLSVFLPLARPDRVAVATLLCFALYAAVAIFVFAARSVARVWLVLLGASVLLGLATWLAGDYAVRP